MYKGLLFTADIHLRPDVPVCRTDDFLKVQWQKFDQVQKYIELNQLAWVDAGDIFHKAQLPLVFVNQVLENMRERIVAGVMGNHDLPSHNIGRVGESAWGTLWASAYLEQVAGSEPVHIKIGSDHFPKERADVDIYGVSYGEEIPQPYNDDVFKVLVMHDMVYASKNDIIPNAPGSLAKKLLRDNKEYDLIVTGHNHQSFMVELNGRFLVNVGSMTRQTADQTDHKPRVVEWRPGWGLKWYELDYKDGVISREHIEKQEQKDEELNAFVASLQDVEEVSLSFEENVETVIRESKPEKPVEDKVREAME